MTQRGDEVPRRNPWEVKPADPPAARGWDQLVVQAREAADRAWVAVTSEPRRTVDRQHQLKGGLSTTVVAGRRLDVWQYEPTSAGRIWYAIDDDKRTLWLIQVSVGHPQATERRRR